MSKRKGNVHPILDQFGEKLSPFSFDRLYGEEKYRLQNMVLNMADFPAEYEEGVDQVFSIYADRAHTQWWAAASLVESTSSGDAWFNGVSHDDFLKFAGKLFGALNNHRKCTGDALTYKAYQYANEYELRYKELYGSIALSGMWRGREDEFEGDEYRRFLDLSIATDKWAQKQAMEEVVPLPITGALMIRMTNVSSGYPCPVLIGVIQKSKLPRYNGGGPLIEYPKMRYGMDIYGGHLDELEGFYRRG